MDPHLRKYFVFIWYYKKKITVAVLCFSIVAYLFYKLAEVSDYAPIPDKFLIVNSELGLNSKRFLGRKYIPYQKPNLSKKLTNLLEIRKIPDNIRLIGDSQVPLFAFDQFDEEDDRVMNQMMFIPKDYGKQKKKPKLFVYVKDKTNDGFPSPSDMTICPVGNCRFSFNKSLAPVADVLLYLRINTRLTHKRPPHQIWASMTSESPYVFFPSNFLKNELNWTINYRRDTVVQFPYFKYYPYDMTKQSPKRPSLPDKNYALGKTKFVATFVSNCVSKNGRENVTNDLGRYIKVDVYGRCGTLKCPRSGECFQKLKNEYKFYLSFENSNCRDYITEKFFFNALGNDVIPIVMGAHPEDYKRVAPPHSYIHIEEFRTIEDLANYMIYLDKNDTAYNEYFGWKSYGTVKEKTYLYCRLCMMAHQADTIKSTVADLPSWIKYGKYNENSKSFYSTDICIGNKRWTY